MTLSINVYHYIILFTVNNVTVIYEVVYDKIFCPIRYELHQRFTLSDTLIRNAQRILLLVVGLLEEQIQKD